MVPPRARFPVLALLGGALLVGLWWGPLPEAARSSFAAHMTLHMGVVAVAAPLVAVGTAGRRADPVRSRPYLFAPVPAAVVELVVVWGWHAPVLHRAARASAGIFALEQMSFLAAGLLVWLSAFGGDAEARRERSGPGALGLLLTSMHMTLLGALLGLASRPLYHLPGEEGIGPWGWTALEDQHVGGAVMLGVGGAVYLAGALTLVRRLLRSRLPMLDGGPVRRGAATEERSAT